MKWMIEKTIYMSMVPVAARGSCTVSDTFQVTLIRQSYPAHGAQTLVDPLVPVTWGCFLAFVGQSLITPVKV